MNKPYADEASMRRVGPLLILLVAAVALVLAAVAALTRLWGVEATSGWRNETRLEGPEPALETAPQRALDDYLESKRRILDSYGWVDPSRHLARIPIEAAMRALAADSATPPSPDSAQYLMGADTRESP